MSATTDALGHLNRLAGEMDRWAAKYGPDGGDLSEYAEMCRELGRVARVFGERSITDLAAELDGVLGDHSWTSEGQLRGVEYTSRAEFVTNSRVLLERIAKHTTQ